MEFFLRTIVQVVEITERDLNWDIGNFNVASAKSSKQVPSFLNVTLHIP